MERKYGSDARINLGGSWYNITIIEKEAMKQEVTADAKFMADGISSTGHVFIYGIYFDFNKSDVSFESDLPSRRLPSSSPITPTSRFSSWDIRITQEVSTT